MLVFPLGELARFSHLGFHHLVKIEPRLGSFNKVCIEELCKRFKGINSHKGFRAEIGQLCSNTGVKGMVCHVSMVYNPSNCIIIREDGWSCNNHMKARVPNYLINKLINLEV